MESSGESGKPVRLEVHDLRGAESGSVGLAVACPRRGWIAVIHCLVCTDFDAINVDLATSRAVLVCTPAP